MVFCEFSIDFAVSSSCVSYIEYFTNSSVSLLPRILANNVEIDNAVVNGLGCNSAISSPTVILLYKGEFTSFESFFAMEARNAFNRSSIISESHKRSIVKSILKLALTAFWFSFISINISNCLACSIPSKATTGMVFLSLYSEPAYPYTRCCPSII